MGPSIAPAVPDPICTQGPLLLGMAPAAMP